MKLKKFFNAEKEKMFFNILTSVFLLCFLLLLLMCCAVCQSTSVKNAPETPPTSLALFKPEVTEITKKDDDRSKEKFHSFTTPNLYYVNNKLVVFAQAKNVTASKEKCDIVESYFELKDKNGGLTNKLEKVTDDGEWKMKLVTKNDEKKCTGSPTAVVDNTDIHMFFKNSTYNEDNDFQFWVVDGQAQDNDNGIKWGTSFNNLAEQLKVFINNLSNIVYISGGGPGISVNDTLVVPVMYKNNDDVFSTIIKFEKSNKKQWELLPSSFPANCTVPTVTEWEGKLIMMTSCSDGYYKVYDSSNMGVNWTEAVGFLSGVWGNTEKRETKKYSGQSRVITVKFEGIEKKVILFTQAVGKEIDNCKLHLWMTDYQRVYDIEITSVIVGQNVSSTLLFAEDNLFAAYEKWDAGKSTIHVMHLKKQLEEIKNVLRKWIKQDDDLKKSCITAEWELKSDSTCTDNKIPINGLVGFLSNNYSNNMWKDKYWCVNAAVTEKTGASTVSQVGNGLQFSGAGVGATWPVGNQEQNQQYYFANYAFTLMATVRIDGDATNKKNSVLGIGLKENGTNEKSIGLWCSEGKWGVGDGKGTAEIISNTKNCANEKTYQVALTLKDKTVSVYINGNKIDKLSKKSINVQKEKITHFYFGAHNGEQTTQPTTAVSHVTVKNVLLYNRQFGDDEIGKLKPKQIKPQESIKTPKEDIKADQRDDNTAASGDQQPPTLPASPSGEEKAPSPSRTEDGGVGGGVRVFSLLLAVLCVSAPLLHL